MSEAQLEAWLSALQATLAEIREVLNTLDARLADLEAATATKLRVG